ncbi:arrestin domain-containing protein 3-like isoform X1 [Penaeus monodon]|uniref:arrestin domain-containing protein 3-like isoform X1 n=1 Tax=Penaeus monodon TaxID=6687 RepID=UPI0018A78EE9|nr:arrestin domain-containing protein 3-like isoform X1 [Penaeus monodon]
MPTGISIEFDNSKAVFFSGQSVTGRVRVTCDKPKYCRAIEVEFQGYGKVHWTERSKTQRNGKQRTKTVHFKSNESYYLMSYIVWGNGTTESELPPGTHLFNFSFLLPHGIPSSFESHIGKVRHQCKAKMDIPWKTDKVSVKAFSVNTLYDLNMDPEAKVPIECSKHDYACCLFCRSGPMSLVLRIDRSGFVPGENIIVNAECSNMTNVKINYTKAVVHQTITYHAEGRKKKDHRKVAELKRLEIPPGEDDNWNNVEMLIPALPPSHLQFCNLIDIDYELKFEMSPSGCHMDLEHTAPVKIGSIPLVQYFSNFVQGPPTNSAQLTNLASVQPPVPAYAPPGQPPLPNYSPAPGQHPGVGCAAIPGQQPMPGQPPMMNPPIVPYQPPIPGQEPMPGQPPVPGESQMPGQPPVPGTGPGQSPVLGFAPSIPGQQAVQMPSNNPAQPSIAVSNVDQNTSPYNPNFQPASYPIPGSPRFPGVLHYPQMPLPTYNQCMFGTTSIAEIDSDVDDGQNHNEIGFAPHYISYSLVNSKRLQSAASVGDTGGGMDGITSGVSDLHIRRDSGSSGSSGDHYRGGRTAYLIVRVSLFFVSV